MAERRAMNNDTWRTYLIILYSLGMVARLAQTLYEAFLAQSEWIRLGELARRSKLGHNVAWRLLHIPSD
jgi:hypothetical protein